MNTRLVLGAFVLGLVAGCSFSDKYEQYCRTSGKCACDSGQCCVLANQECDSNVGCCAGLYCNQNGKCASLALGGGTGGGGTTGGGGGTGGGGTTGGGSGGALTVLDGGIVRESGLWLVYPDGGLVSTDWTCPDGGQYPTWIHPDGGVTREACCSPNYATGLCTNESLSTCAMPGFPSSPGRPCCFCDQNCAEDQSSMICPQDSNGPIDLLVPAIRVTDLASDAFCADGGLKVLEGCCTPDPSFTQCNFAPSGSCSLDTGGNVCCFTAWAYPPFTLGPILLNDCRVNGACECNPTTGVCVGTQGAVCVDILMP